MLGKGMKTPETVCWIPICCRSCRGLHVANRFKVPITCPKCGGPDVITYDALKLLGEAGEQDVFYFCPACQQKHLRFEKSGWWD
jgi:hypothetical protein